MTSPEPPDHARNIRVVRGAVVEELWCLTRSRETGKVVQMDRVSEPPLEFYHSEPDDECRG